MKYLITLAFLAVTTPLFAQDLLVVKGKTTTTSSSNTVTSAIKFESGTGERGTVKRDDNITYISYCQNTGDSLALKAHNKRDTTNYRASVTKTDNIITIKHPNGQQSTITDEGDLIMVKAAGGVVAVFHKSQYTAGVSDNSKQKDNVTMIAGQDGTYEMMIITGKTAVVINSDNTYSLAIKENDKVTAMPSEGFQSFIYIDDEKLRIVYANGEVQKTAGYGCLGLLASKK